MHLVFKSGNIDLVKYIMSVDPTKTQSKKYFYLSFSMLLKENFEEEKFFVVVEMNFICIVN